MGTSMTEFARQYEQTFLKKNETLPEKKRGHKYGAKAMSLDGIRFDSKAEGNFYGRLKLLQRAGLIKEIQLQPSFLLQEPFTDRYGEMHNAISYIADFRVTFPDGSQKVYDTKGVRTKEYVIKKKLFLMRYPDALFEEVYFSDTHPVVPNPLDLKFIREEKKKAGARTKLFEEKIRTRQKRT